MLLKMIGGIMVIISCSMIGFLMAGSYCQRPRVLRNLETALSMLETEINYGHSPLPEALESISKKCEKEVSSLFLKTAKIMRLREGLTADEAWEKTLKEFSCSSFLSNSDIEILVSFGRYLGSTDREDQIKNIKLTLTNLKQQEKIALEEKQKNEKLWKYLGVLSGIMVFLLLY
jgi:stage III sporulation protein AB